MKNLKTLSLQVVTALTLSATLNNPSLASSYADDAVVQIQNEDNAENAVTPVSSEKATQVAMPTSMPQAGTTAHAETETDVTMAPEHADVKQNVATEISEPMVPTAATSSDVASVSATLEQNQTLTPASEENKTTATEQTSSPATIAINETLTVPASDVQASTPEEQTPVVTPESSILTSALHPDTMALTTQAPQASNIKAEENASTQVVQTASTTTVAQVPTNSTESEKTSAVVETKTVEQTNNNAYSISDIVHKAVKHVRAAVQDMKNYVYNLLKKSSKNKIEESVSEKSQSNL